MELIYRKTWKKKTLWIKFTGKPETYAFLRDKKRALFFLWPVYSNFK